MSPEMLVRISARNDTGPGFQSVVKDARAASEAVVVSGTAAEASLVAEAGALATVETAARLSGSQVAELGHITRSMIGTLSNGGSVMQAFAQEGNRVASVFTIGQGGVGGTFRAIGGLLAGFLPLLAPIAAVVGTVAAGFAGLTYEINKTSKTHVSFGNVFMATMQVAAGALGKFFKPAIDQLGAWFGQLIDWITPAFKTAVNGIIGAFVFAFDAVKDTWSLLPSALGDLVLQAVNNVINGVQAMINGSIDLINNNLLAPLKAVGVDIGTIGKIDFGGGVANPFAGSASKTAGVISTDAGKAFSQDYAGQAFGAISAQAQKLALGDAAKETGKSTDDATKKVRDLADKGIGYLTDKTKTFADAFKSAFSGLGSGVISAIRQGGDVLSSIFNMLEDRAFNLLGGLLDNSLSGLVGNLMPHFANGGSGVVGGSGGTDSQLFMARVSPGEPYAFGRDAVRGMGGGSGGDHLAVHVTTEVVNGNLVPTMVHVSGQVAGKMIQQSVPAAQQTYQRDGAFA